MLHNIAPDDAMRMLTENFWPGRRTSVNCYALALIETGSGDYLLPTAGMHVHFPGFAHVVRRGDGYVMLPEPWDQAFGN